MYLMIDNYDSFVYNLSSYFEELGEKILVKRNNEISLKEIEELHPQGIIISPGPKSPLAAGLSIDIVKNFKNKIPILGVCLGHQVIGASFGASIIKGKIPMHGKVTSIVHRGTGLFENLPSRYKVTRYHSLVIDEDSLSQEFEVSARAEEGAIMAISHKRLPVFGVQFHPEAVLTEYGYELLENFIKISINEECQYV
ncbi:MAG: aminodeoxychorismate/anthranilate synthase component II [Eubacterium sp.]